MHNNKTKIIFVALFTNLLFCSQLFAQNLTVNAAIALIDGFGHAEIPDTYTSMSAGAFDGAHALKSVTIPTSITSIPAKAFESTPYLEEIIFPNSITYIGDNAFAGSGVKKAYIPSSVQGIGWNNFSIGIGSCQLTEVTIGMLNIPENLFDRCPLTIAVIEDSVVSIGKESFESTNITSLTLPNSVTEVSERAFAETKLTNLIIPESIVEIGVDAFYSETLQNAFIFANPENIGWSPENVFHENTQITFCQDIDNDSDGVANCLDSFPDNSLEWNDLDLDGMGDNSDAFPLNDQYQKDGDSDGMPDSWEQSYGLNPENPADASSDQDHDGKTALEEFTENTMPSGTMDLDGNGYADALTDGLIILRYLFGLRENALIKEAISPSASYISHEEISSRIILMGDYYDIDQNGALDALTDGLMIHRYLFGLNTIQLTQDAIGNGSNRNQLPEILLHLDALKPSDRDLDGVHDEFDLFPYDPNEIGDHDGDDIGNNTDTDDDNDGVSDSEDVFPRNASETIDTDGDGIGNNADTDDDNDGIADSNDAYALDPTLHKAQVWGESDWGKTKWKPNNSGFTWGESTWSE